MPKLLGLTLVAIVCLTMSAFAGDRCETQKSGMKRCEREAGGTLKMTTHSTPNGDVTEMEIYTPNSGDDAAGLLALAGMSMAALGVPKAERAKLFERLLGRAAEQNRAPIVVGRYGWLIVWRPDKSMTVRATRLKPQGPSG
jgi:hypothetical protein